MAAGIGRVKGVKRLGYRSGNWLSLEQSSELLNHARGRDEFLVRKRWQRAHAPVDPAAGLECPGHERLQ